MQKNIFWLGILFTVCLLLYFVSGTLTPFIISFIFAYLLEPIIDSNCRRFNLSRPLVTAAVFTLFTGSFILFLALVIPAIYRQTAIFISKAPLYKRNITEAFATFLEKLHIYAPKIEEKLGEFVKNFVDTAFSVLTSFADHLWDYTLATINIFVIIILVPIILYYFLRDWHKIINSVGALLPLQGRAKIKEIFISIDKLLSAYIRGQLNICLILSVFYIISFSLIGMDLALLMGLISGFLIIIPFIGSIISFIVVIINCYISFGFSSELTYTTILFVAGHVVEGYILTPKIIGDKIGLHPVWILFAILTGGSLFGLLGVLFAIPMAGVIKILLSHFIAYYKAGNMYRG